MDHTYILLQVKISFDSLAPWYELGHHLKAEQRI